MEEAPHEGHTDTAAANNGPALRSLASPILLAADASLPERQFSPLKASHRSIDLTPSHTLRPSSVRHRPYMQLNGLFVRVPLHLGRRIGQRNTLSCVCVGGEEIAVWMAGCVRAIERAPHGHRLPSPPCAVFGAAKSRSREAPCWCPSSRRPAAACTRSADRQTLRSPNGKGGDGTTMEEEGFGAP